MARRTLPWLLALPLMAAGSLLAHSLAYALVEPGAAERARLLRSTGHGYLAAAPVEPKVAAPGDFVQYTLSLENTSSSGDVEDTQIVDVLPPGLRFQPGSVRVARAAGAFDLGADPQVAADGRTLTFDTGVWHARTALPPICTVQAPHWPMPHPNLVPLKFRTSLRTQSRGMSPGTSTVELFPLTFSVKAMALTLYKVWELDRSESARTVTFRSIRQVVSA